jgi:hypothetical protein
MPGNSASESVIDPADSVVGSARPAGGTRTRTSITGPGRLGSGRTVSGSADHCQSRLSESADSAGRARAGLGRLGPGGAAGFVDSVTACHGEERREGA